MSKIYYNKLVRDRMPAMIEAKGETSEVRALSDDHEFEQELLKKIVEESRALAHVRSRADFLEEYADLMVALDALTELLGLSEADIKLALSENAEQKGLYNERQFLRWSSDVGYECKESPQGVSDKS